MDLVGSIVLGRIRKRRWSEYGEKEMLVWKGVEERVLSNIVKLVRDHVSILVRHYKVDTNDKIGREMIIGNMHIMYNE